MTHPGLVCWSANMQGAFATIKASVPFEQKEEKDHDIPALPLNFSLMRSKISYVLKEAKTSKVQIIALQETLLTSTSQLQKLQSEFPLWTFTATLAKSANSAGVIIACLTESIDQIIQVSDFVNTDGRWCFMKLKLKDQNIYTFHSIHLENDPTARITQLKNMQKHAIFENAKEENHVILGDFNSVLSDLDSANPSASWLHSKLNKAALQTERDFMLNLYLTDAFRTLYPQARVYSRTSTRALVH